MIQFYNKHTNPYDTEWASLLYRVGDQVLLGNEEFEGVNSGLDRSVWMRFEDALAPNPKGRIHMHYLSAGDQEPSDRDVIRHHGEGIYNIVISNNDIHFYNRGVFNHRMMAQIVRL